jgi:hypothetical protein
MEVGKGRAELGRHIELTGIRSIPAPLSGHSLFAVYFWECLYIPAMYKNTVSYSNVHL